MFDVIAFDADDTLWHNETLYLSTQETFKKILAKYLDVDVVEGVLYETEMRNLTYFGYGIKSFTLSMIETAIELTDGEIRGRDVHQIIELAKDMLNSPIQPLEGVETTLALLSKRFPLMLVTKGDLLDQESKIARSGLANYLTHVEIVSEKIPQTYRDILARHNVEAARFLMVGNSLKSDVLPALAIGGRAVYIPYQSTWAHEVLNIEGEQDYVELEHIGQLSAWLDRLLGGASSV